VTLTRRQFLVAAGVAGLGVAGCGSTAIEPASGPELAGGYTGPPVTISFWNGFTGGDGPAMRRLVAAFNDTQDRIVVEQNTVRWEQFYQRVVAAVHAGKGPDVGAMHLEQLGTQAARQTVNPLDDVVDDLGLRAQEYPESVWEAGRYQDRRYGIPFDVHSLASFANLDLLERTARQQPADASSMTSTMTALQQAGVEAPFWVPNAWPAHLIFLSLLWQHGGEPYARDGSRATFDSDAGIAALQWMRGQVDAGFSPPDVAEDSQYTAFKNGQGVFTWDGIWQINDLQTNARTCAGASPRCRGSATSPPSWPTPTSWCSSATGSPTRTGWSPPRHSSST
jgi:multiple sugar transport system substrate-binding protein